VGIGGIAIAITPTEKIPFFSALTPSGSSIRRKKEKRDRKQNEPKRNTARRDVVQQGNRKKNARKNLVSGVVGRTFNVSTGEEGEKVG